MATNEPGIKIFAHDDFTGTLILNFSAARTERSKCSLLINYPYNGIMLKQSVLTKRRVEVLRGIVLSGECLLFGL